jgi:hypothetical protein
MTPPPMTTMSVEILLISSVCVLKAEDQPARYTLKLSIPPAIARLFDDQNPRGTLWRAIGCESHAGAAYRVT